MMRLVLIFIFLLCLSFSSALLFDQKEDIKAAARLIDIHLDPSEIDSMASGIEQLQKDITKNRATGIPNAVAPALTFNPLPAGFEINENQEAIRFSSYKARLPKDKNQLAFYSIGELAALIKSKQISSVELTKFFISRLKKYDQTLHCVISLTEELAMAQATKADREIAAGNYKGMLHGIPYGAKDLLATAKYKTTWGAMPYKDQSFDYNATVIKKLEDAGAVLVAKLSLGALAWGDVWYGEKTRNPWDPSTGSSGSSAGSASSVAAGLVPFAIGTETLGSIVSPSTVCGTTGLRPTFGSVSRYGAMALSWSMDKIGPICRTVEDCAIVFSAIKGKDNLDNSTVDAAFNYSADDDVSKLKVGYLKSNFDRDYRFKKQDSLALVKLKSLGVDLIPIELPTVPSIRFILNAEAAAAFDELTRTNQDDQLVRQIKNAWPNVFRQARLIPAVEYIQANRLRTTLIEEMDAVMQEVDLYVCPSWGSPSLTLTNLTGHPQVVLPNGFISGKPTSISFVGKLYDDAQLLEFAKFYQDNTSFHTKHPDAFIKSE